MALASTYETGKDSWNIHLFIYFTEVFKLIFISSLTSCKTIFFLTFSGNELSKKQNL